MAGIDLDDLLARHGRTARRDDALGASGRRTLLGLSLLLVIGGPVLNALDFLYLVSQVLVFALFALALDFVFGYTRLPSFGHAAMFGSAGYGVAFLLMHVTQSPLAVLPVAFLVGVVVGGAIGWLSVRSHGIYFAMLTLAFAQVLYIVAFNDFLATVFGVEQVTAGDNGLIGIPAYSLLGVDLGGRVAYYYLTLLVTGISIALLFRLANSPFGRVLQGIRENEQRVRALGYDTTRYKVVAFALSGGFTGLAGGLFVPLKTIVHPSMLHWTLSGELIVMVLLGGMGTLWGPMVGATVVVIMEDLLSFVEGWRLLLGTLFIVVIIFAPNGIAGIVRSLRENPRRAVTNLRRAVATYIRNIRR